MEVSKDASCKTIGVSTASTVSTKANHKFFCQVADCSKTFSLLSHIFSRPSKDGRKAKRSIYILLHSSQTFCQMESVFIFSKRLWKFLLLFSHISHGCPIQSGSRVQPENQICPQPKWHPPSFNNFLVLP